jgi:hypothetical protein
LPDASPKATRTLGLLLVGAAVVAVVMNAFGWTAKPFDPAANSAANFALFAGFYVAAQVIERLMQLISPNLPWWSVDGTGAARVAQIKADRATVSLGVAAVLGVAASCGFGLFFLTAIGMHVTHTIDSFVTGITVAAGTKPLHDFISLLQNQNAPATQTTPDA